MYDCSAWNYQPEFLDTHLLFSSLRWETLIMKQKQIEYPDLTK
jgi:hypothetical protein